MKFSELPSEIRKKATPAMVVKYWWLWCLIAITVFSFWSRMIPAQYGQLQALDPFYAYRMDEYMLQHNLQLPSYDYLRYWPDGVPLSKYGPLMYLYVPVVVYLAFMFVGISMTFLQFAITYPAFMGAVSVFVIFWIAKEIFDDKKAGLFSSLFLAAIPAYIARTSAGFFDKEATGGTFLLISVYLFIKAYKTNSWKYGILSAVTVFIAMGSWGGSQFIMYIIPLFIIIKLLLNQYKDSMLPAVIPPMVSAFLTQQFFLGYVNITFEQMISAVTIALVLIRFAAVRYKLVKKETLPYLMPALLGLLVLSVLIGSMFSDVLWSMVNRAINLLFLPQQGVIGSTVAEQMPGTWNDIVSRATVSYGSSIVPVGSIGETLFSAWFLMILGGISIVYSIYSERKWILLLPLLWLLMSIQTVFYMVRLVFFLGPPVSIVAGFFLADIVNRVNGLKYNRERRGLRRINVLTVPLIAVLSLIVLTNLAAGFVFCSSLGPSFNQYWGEAMNYLSEQTPVNASVLSWWDFGYWFQTEGHRPSTADGGNINGTVNEQIADWFVSSSANWTDYRPWLEGKDVSYILMDYTLPGKYGAISKIGSRGKEVVGMLQFQQSGTYPQDNKTIIEYRAGQYAIWIPVSDSGNIAGPPMFMIVSNDQYVGKTYINDICTTNGILRIESPEGSDKLPGCIAIAPYGMFYIPQEAEFTTFTDLMFMDGYGIPDVTKVFDNGLIKIYKLAINETVSS